MDHGLEKRQVVNWQGDGFLRYQGLAKVGDKSDDTTNIWHRVSGDNISTLLQQWKSKREGQLQLQLCSLLKITQSFDAGRTSKLDDGLKMFAFDQGYFLF